MKFNVKTRIIILVNHVYKRMLALSRQGKTSFTKASYGIVNIKNAYDSRLRVY